MVTLSSRRCPRTLQAPPGKPGGAGEEPAGEQGAPGAGPGGETKGSSKQATAPGSHRCRTRRAAGRGAGLKQLALVISY